MLLIRNYPKAIEINGSMSDNRLYLQERLHQIVTLVEEEGRVSVAELAERFQVSAVTIRSDLATLEGHGYLLRTHGGAMARPTGATVPAFSLRQTVNAAEKQRIGRTAAALVHDGDSIILDDSTTAWQVARHLKDHRELTVVTNSLYIALEFVDTPGVTVVMTGGTLRSVSASLVGDQGDCLLEGYHVQKGFFGVRGLTLEEGLTDPDQYGVEMKRRMVERSREVIVIADASKWNRLSFATFATLDQVNQIITDQGAPADMVRALQDRGIQVMMV
jgi:DeoR/GlpR family transcriptional regulator of sugar metabolism